MKNFIKIISAGIACLSLCVAPVSASTYQYVTADSLNVRLTPSTTEENVIKSVPYRERLTVLEKGKEWSKILCANGSVAYCNSQYLSDTQPAIKTVKKNSASKGKYIGTFQLTAYCNCSLCCGKWAGGPTASGTVPTEGRTVACNSIPMGTHIIINGHEYIVEDTGAMGNNVIDIYMASHSAGNQFGRKFNVPVYYAN